MKQFFHRTVELRGGAKKGADGNGMKYHPTKNRTNFFINPIRKDYKTAEKK